MVQIDEERYEVTLDGMEVKLAPKELGVLIALKKADGRVMSRRKILETVWGKRFVNWDPRIVDQHVARIRRKLRRLKANLLLVTVSGAGYKFKRA